MSMDTAEDKTNVSGVAGRTNYDQWGKKTNSLLAKLALEEEHESIEAKDALGLNAKYARSEAEADEKEKRKRMAKAKRVLDNYKKRESKNVQQIYNLFSEEEEKEDMTKIHRVKYITRDLVDAGRRVLSITDSFGPGHIILTQDLSHLESKMNTKSTSTPLTSRVGETENQGKSHDDPDLPISGSNDEEEESYRTIHGLIKLYLSNLHDITVSIRCKIITGFVEISHCKNLTLKVEKEATIATIQADLCSHLNIEFHDAPSGKNIPSLGTGSTTTFWGQDKDDRVFHAGVSHFHLKIFRDGYLDMDTQADYINDGAEAVGNAKAEEVQFVTSVVEGSLLTERVLRAGSATGTTVTGGIGSTAIDRGGAARAMTAREMQEVEKKKAGMLQTLSSQIKVVDKSGVEVPPITSVSNTDSNDESNIEEVDEVYAGISSSDIKAIVMDCDAHKMKGNESFAAGEYAQAILLYTMALDRAAELPDHSDVELVKKGLPMACPLKQLFPRHIALANRSASFLKLGHHEKALIDSCEAHQLEPNYVKSIFRKGLALHAMGRYQEALESLSVAHNLEPNNKQIKQALQFAEVRYQQELRKRMEGN